MPVKPVEPVAHPLIQHHLLTLRDRDTRPADFRVALRRLTALLIYPATEDLFAESCEVATPLTECAGEALSETVGLVPILRAGLGMVEPVLAMLPDAAVWHLGLYRDESTLEPVEYYQKLPEADPVDVALVLDPMLATGGSAVAALDTLERWGVKRTKLLCIIAAPEGVAHVEQKHPTTQIHVCAIDSHLNDQAYIVPGLGDAGDRIFNAVAE